MVIIGPCLNPQSHRCDGVRHHYLQSLRNQYRSRLEIVMRTYF
ncbi:hypothetical protein ACNKHN_08675 [Shigella flexneri]